MRAIPAGLRDKLSKSEFMEKCIHPGCMNPPEWEHAWIYAGKQINEEWAIVPCCYRHHRGDNLDKEFNQWVSINLAKAEDLQKYPKKIWQFEKNKLNGKYGFDSMFSSWLTAHMHKVLNNTI